jgi:hypothetical protein
MKASFWKGTLAAAIAFSLLSGSTGQAAQEQQGQEQRGIEGVWDVSLTVVSCASSAPLFTDPHGAILMFIDGGTLTEIADRANRSAGLGSGVIWAAAANRPRKVVRIQIGRQLQRNYDKHTRN